MIKLERIEAVAANVLGRRASRAAEHQAKYLAINTRQCIVQRPHINIKGKGGVFSTPSTPRHSLTSRSTGTSMLRIAAR
jgi:hypothetical protein